MIPTPRVLVRNFRFMGKRDLLRPLRWEYVRAVLLLWLILVVGFIVIAPIGLAKLSGMAVRELGIWIDMTFDSVADFVAKWTGLRFLGEWSQRRVHVMYLAAKLINGLNASQIITKKAVVRADDPL